MCSLNHKAPHLKYKVYRQLMAPNRNLNCQVSGFHLSHLMLNLQRLRNRYVSDLLRYIKHSHCLSRYCISFTQCMNTSCLGVPLLFHCLSRYCISFTQCINLHFVLNAPFQDNKTYCPTSGNVLRVKVSSV